MQLVAYGAQDIYLTGQPQITFFKAIYRRHTNFAVESIQQTINGKSMPGNRVSVTISRNGDLLKNLWIQYYPNSIFKDNSAVMIASDFTHSLIDQLEIEIGGQLIDKHYGKWLTVWRALTEVNPYGLQSPLSVDRGSDNVISGETAVITTLYNKMSYNHLGALLYPEDINLSTGDHIQNTLLSAPNSAFIPMCFWFCRNPGLAIPLIALQYHEVKFNINFANIDSFAYAGFTGATQRTPNVDFSSFKVYADYVYLDTTERRQFAQNAHEYLIDQLQLQSGENDSTIRLNFNHPVKELIFTGTPKNVATSASVVVTGGATPSAIVDSLVTSDVNARLVLNGTDRFTDRHLTYFTRCQVWDHHTGYGSTVVRDSVGLYSFALRPEEHQPSGTCNFSRIDNAQLKFSANINSIDIYAVNYNVLRIMSGMGGLAYSN